MRNWNLILAILLLFFLPSCKEPNIYSNAGLYNPIKEKKAETLEIEKGKSFNLLDISSSYDGIINLEYRPAGNYEILRQLGEDDVTALSQTVSYLSRFGGLEEYLAKPIGSDLQKACEDTRAFATEIILDVKSCVTSVAEEIEKYDQSIDSSPITDFFDELIRITSPESGYETLEDYLAIQLTLDMIAASIDMLYTIIISLPTDITTYSWDAITEDNGMLTKEDAIASIRDNTLNLVSIILDAASEMDMIGGSIPSFISLGKIIGEFI